MSNEVTLVVVAAVVVLLIVFALFVIFRAVNAFMAHDEAIDELFSQLEKQSNTIRRTTEKAEAATEQVKDFAKIVDAQISAISERVERLNVRAENGPKNGRCGDNLGGDVTTPVKVRTCRAASANKWALVKTEDGESVAHFNTKFFTSVANTDIYHLDDVEFIIKAVNANRKS